MSPGAAPKPFKRSSFYLAILAASFSISKNMLYLALSIVL